ncbi:MAG: C40 family peptidase [Proteobacteria bacterium]|nr:C40 family peptidase [Pseudomonadota bacterium]
MLAEKGWWRTFWRFGGVQILVLAALLLCLQGCAPKVRVSYYPQQKRTPGSEKPAVSKENVLLLQRHYEKWRGTPYIDGGMSSSGIDCSGFTVLAYRDLFGLSLPRTAGEQAESGREVTKASLKTGDLVFFNTGRTKKHVGIYLADDQFIHASLSKGVTLSSLDDSYWHEKYWQARRLQSSVHQGKANSSAVASYRR